MKTFYVNIAVEFEAESFDDAVSMAEEYAEEIGALPDVVAANPYGVQDAEDVEDDEE